MARVRFPDSASQWKKKIYFFSSLNTHYNKLWAPIVQWLEFVPSKHEVRVRFPVGAKKYFSPPLLGLWCNWLSLWTLNPTIRVQIPVGPFIIIFCKINHLDARWTQDAPNCGRKMDQQKKKYFWRTRVSIPVPRRCERRALPIELVPLLLLLLIDIG